MLELKNIVKVYKTGDTEVEALKGVSMSFRKSEFVSVLGASGCGKTTLLNIIGGLDKYTSGDLIISGRSTKQFGDRDWDAYRNHSIGFVFQSYNLIGHQTVLANVEMALALSGIGREERTKRAKEALNKVGLQREIKKMPNQLSGGQMQRVAIARALVNDPEIILADEPTGALDSKTSVQVIDLLQEIAADRLVIMVTHNSELAKKYSTRIISLSDGEVISDTNPPTDEETKQPINTTKQKRTAMSYFTALGLSLRNLLTKKGRTLLTSFAGSIGIIGIALVLAISGGLTSYIDKMQADTLSNYPLTISSSTRDLVAMMELMQNNASDYVEKEKFPDTTKVEINKVFQQLQTSMTVTNKLTNEYIENVIEKIPENLYYSIQYSYGTTLSAYAHVNYTLASQYGDIDVDGYSELSSQIMGKLNKSSELLSSQYDVLAGSWPSGDDAKNQVVLCVDQFNRLNDVYAAALGIDYGMYDKEAKEDEVYYDFSDILGRKFKLLTNEDLYIYDETTDSFSKRFTASMTGALPLDVENYGITLEIVGIIRLNKDTDLGSLMTPIGYTQELEDYVRNSDVNSDIVKWQTAHAYKSVTDCGVNVLSGEPFADMDEYTSTLRSINGATEPSSISIYPRDFDGKEEIKKLLDNYNNSVEKEEDKVVYTDLMAVLVSSLNTFINSISYVLIAFTAISLVVSSIMIGIITYISVLERTKEIGILRAIGARKKDISRVFNAETLILGFIAGMLGVGITYLLCIPINIILTNLTGINSLAYLAPLNALILVLISMALTLIAGFIPSKFASKKDPVVALRTE